MPLSHILLAILVSIIWGLNFIFLKLSLEEISPLFLCAIRFTLANLPAIFFIKPQLSAVKVTILYGLVMFALQFSLLFLGIKAGMTAGMASLTAQTQVFFSMFFSVIFLNENFNHGQILGAIVAFLGIILVALNLDHSTITLAGFLLVLSAAATWGVGNIITKVNKNINMMSLLIWGCFFATFPMWLIAFYFEGADKLIFSYHHLTYKGIIGALYTIYISTLVGYGLWNWLLVRYPMGAIVPFNLLIPVVGILGSIIFFAEPFPFWKISACLLVITGLYINFKNTTFFKEQKDNPAFQSYESKT